MSGCNLRYSTNSIQSHLILQYAQKYSTLQTLHQKLKEELDAERKIKISLENDFDDKIKNHEEEVSLRLKLENKLNSLYSIHRDLENKYKRALGELSQQEVVSSNMVDEMEKLKQDIYDTKSDNIE